jgi:hypothetical protein
MRVPSGPVLLLRHGKRSVKNIGPGLSATLCIDLPERELGYHTLYSRTLSPLSTSVLSVVPSLLAWTWNHLLYNILVAPLNELVESVIQPILYFLVVRDTSKADHARSKGDCVLRL